MENDELMESSLPFFRDEGDRLGSRRTRQAHRFRISRAPGHPIFVDVITTLAA
jgi:hypothetical protein